MLLSKETYSALRLYIILSVHVFPGNWTHNLFALLTQCSTTEPQEHNQCCWLINLLLLFVHIVNISGINCYFGCIGFYYMDTNAHTLVWGPILTINYDFCLNKLLICCLLIVKKAAVKQRIGPETFDLPQKQLKHSSKCWKHLRSSFFALQNE